MTSLDADVTRFVESLRRRALIASQLRSEATPPHHSGRRHRDIRVGPTKGHQPRVWTYLFELLAEEVSIAITEDQQLQPRDADEFADRMILPTATIRESFAWLVRHRLLLVHTNAGQHFASPDFRALEALLRKQQELERAGARASDTAALTCVRTRHCMAPAAVCDGHDATRLRSGFEQLGGTDG